MKDQTKMTFPGKRQDEVDSRQTKDRETFKGEKGNWILRMTETKKQMETRYPKHKIDDFLCFN